ncbi:DUF4392 domain-containing protein [Haladaptatus halobius]|uniref:DUF4392 domain-containing protein n=1 Tax=Haladaptatus halobius TaxID=2884875 RepID=UPI001D09E700|nr:glutamate cyclase domain-containing protein [Haladaptatus halobius]
MTQPEKDVATIVDDLITTDIGGRDTIYPIAAAAREKQGTNPAMQAAERLTTDVGRGDVVLVLTGFLIPPTMIQETDGPLGAVSVARAVDIGLDANAIIACEPNAVEICKATATAGGLNVLDRMSNYESKQTVSVEAFPADQDEAREYAEEVISELDPAVVIAIEKVGPNRVGVYHNMAGYNITEHTAKVDELYELLDDSVTTIAVGDAGNEVGMGVVEETVRREIKYGSSCQCDCDEGIAAAVSADVLVPATVSNWGGHAIATCLSELVGTPLLHDAELERRMLIEASMAGSIDGIVGGTNAWCDGLPTHVHVAIIELLHEISRSSVHDRGGGELAR